ncbi:ceramide-1-phosphate transfer protein-like [Watersipora subatra]|uniref:ceramide-1-phosphate transfer protein-like n=1 Tax=Watersipora subatra TaxID=2589382 RepID=UPI00355C1BC5
MTEQVQTNGAEPVDCEQTQKVFDLGSVHCCFEKACLETGEVHLANYCNAWRELNKFLNTLGTLFTFVTHDVAEKVDILETYLKSDPENYQTINSMLKFEVDNKITKTKKPSASRTLLRLHRALVYILTLFENLSAAKADAKVSSISREAYDATLSKHHTWIVRKACNLAMYSLPLRSVLLHRIDSEEGAEARIVTHLTNISSSARRVYDITEALYTQFKLHDLP